jgi:hypothetical protein
MGDIRQKISMGCCTGKHCAPDTCMWLPGGLTCGDCRSFYRCAMIYGRRAAATSCDFFPRRFVRETIEVHHEQDA